MIRSFICCLLLIYIGSSCNLLQKYVLEKERIYPILSSYNTRIILYNNSTFRIESTTGFYRENKDTIFLSSLYKKDSITINNLRFNYVDSLSQDSLNIVYTVHNTSNFGLSVLLFVDTTSIEPKWFTPILDKNIAKKDLVKFQVMFNKAGSKYIYLPKMQYNQISFNVEYPSRPNFYLFFDNDKFIIKDNTLIDLPD